MPQSSSWKRALETGMQVTEMRRSQARAVVDDLVAQGQLARDQMSAAVDELIELSRRRTDDLRKVVRKEVQRQLSTIGIATKADLAALERRMAKAQREQRSAPAKKRTTAKKAPAKRATAKKAPAKKAPAKKAPAKKVAKKAV